MLCAAGVKDKKCMRDAGNCAQRHFRKEEGGKEVQRFAHKRQARFKQSVGNYRCIQPSRRMKAVLSKCHDVLTVNVHSPTIIIGNAVLLSSKSKKNETVRVRKKNISSLIPKYSPESKKRILGDQDKLTCWHINNQYNYEVNYNGKA